MKRMKQIFILFAALLAASCSTDDGLLPGTDNGTTDDGLQAVTFNVGMDHPMTRATATEDDNLVHCFMQVFDEQENPVGEIQEQPGRDNYHFTIHLAPDKTYTFCFWADNDDSGVEVTDLKRMPYQPGTIAFVAKVKGTPEEVSQNIILKHVVTKVTLVTTEATEIEEDAALSVSIPYAADYNVLEGNVYTSKTYKTEGITGTFAADAEITSFYILPHGETADITIGCHLLTQTIADVSLTANTHVTLKGDLSANNEKWETTDEYVEYVAKMFRDNFLNEDGSQKGTTDVGGYLFSGTEDEINAFFQKITRKSGFQVNNDTQFIIEVGGTGWGASHLLAVAKNDTKTPNAPYGAVNISYKEPSYQSTKMWTVALNTSNYETFPTITP